MRFILNKIASFFHYLGYLFEGGKPSEVQQLTPIPATAVLEQFRDLTPISITPQREVDDNKRKLLLLLAKDELTDDEHAEINALTAGKDVIILEDT